MQHNFFCFPSKQKIPLKLKNLQLKLRKNLVNIRQKLISCPNFRIKECRMQDPEQDPDPDLDPK
jgi:hypothetical protein